MYIRGSEDESTLSQVRGRAVRWPLLEMRPNQRTHPSRRMPGVVEVELAARYKQKRFVANEESIVVPRCL